MGICLVTLRPQVSKDCILEVYNIESLTLHSIVIASKSAIVRRRSLQDQFVPLFPAIIPGYPDAIGDERIST